MDDLISRQAAIEAINHICPVDTEYDCTLLDRVDVRCVLSDLTSAQRWIPVSYRLPEPGEYVKGVAKYYLVQNKYEDMLVARYTHSRHWEQIYQLEPIEDEIVAWMPLPKPYKTESEE